MSQETGSPVAKQSTVRRFVRLPKSADVANLAKQVWKSPRFEAREVNGVTEFVFSLPILDGIQSLDEGIYHSLFDSKEAAWTRALEMSYLSARSGKGKKKVATYMDTLLYLVFRGALETLMRDAKGLASKYDEPHRTQFCQGIDEDLEKFAISFRRKAGRKRKQDVDEARPIRLYQRHVTLLPSVTTLKQSICDLQTAGIHGNEALLVEINKTMPGHDWMAYIANGAAFLELPTDPGHTMPVQSSLEGKWTPSQLTIGIIRCEENSRRAGRPFKAMTISREIMRGKALMEKAKASNQ